MSEKFDYYYGEESESCSFYRIPRLLVLGTRFSGLSTDAKLLYGLMLDRMNLSARNALALVNRVDYFWAACWWCIAPQVRTVWRSRIEPASRQPQGRGGYGEE